MFCTNPVVMLQWQGILQAANSPTDPENKLQHLGMGTRKYFKSGTLDKMLSRAHSSISDDGTKLCTPTKSPALQRLILHGILFLILIHVEASDKTKVFSRYIHNIPKVRECHLYDS